MKIKMEHFNNQLLPCFFPRFYPRLSFILAFHAFALAFALLCSFCVLFLFQMIL